MCAKKVTKILQVEDKRRRKNISEDMSLRNRKNKPAKTWKLQHPSVDNFSANNTLGIIFLRLKHNFMFVKLFFLAIFIQLYKRIQTVLLISCWKKSYLCCLLHLNTTRSQFWFILLYQIKCLNIQTDKKKCSSGMVRSCTENDSNKMSFKNSQRKPLKLL